MHPFVVGQKYTREDVFRLIGLERPPSGGNWFTGYNEYKGKFFLFCNIGVAGRTGHDYRNKFVGDELLWYAKTGTRLEQPQIKRLLESDRSVLIFWRTDDMAPFVYQGKGTPSVVEDSQAGMPVFVRWVFESPDERSPIRVPEELIQARRYPEGFLKRITVNAYEREPAARQACLEYWGYSCQVCGFKFEEIYGDLGKEFIHVHHITPLATAREDYTVDPIEDLRPVCPNCHAMLHRHSRVMGLDELRALMK